MIIGLLLVAMGLVMPALFTVSSFKIYPTLFLAVEQNEKFQVILAALRLVLLNSLRSFPHYLGGFFLAESIQVTYRGFGREISHALILLAVIPSVYFVIGHVYHIQYDFGVPAVLILAMLVVLGQIDFNLVNLSKKALMVVMLVMAFQFLDVSPSLSDLRFGRGETSHDIKMISNFLGADPFLQGTAVLFFCLMLFNTVLLCKLIRDENKLKMVSEQKEQNERMLMDTRMRVLESRTYMEMQHLVHDLKSPLTSAQALVGVVKFGCTRDGREKEIEYLEQIEGSIERMSTMISEILYDQCYTVLTARELEEAVLAQISCAEYAPLVSVRNGAPDLVICVNKIRFIRALINLLENSFYAVERSNGRILMAIDRVEYDSEGFARIEISDNGGGIPPEVLNLIWEKGYSSRSSHGLGLNFVRNVIERNNGTIKIRSVVGEGTDVTITVPEGET